MLIACVRNVLILVVTTASLWFKVLVWRSMFIWWNLLFQMEGLCGIAGTVMSLLKQRCMTAILWDPQENEPLVSQSQQWKKFTIKLASALCAVYILLYKVSWYRISEWVLPGGSSRDLWNKWSFLSSPNGVFFSFLPEALLWHYNVFLCKL